MSGFQFLGISRLSSGPTAGLTRKLKGVRVPLPWVRHKAQCFPEPGGVEISGIHCH
jgi:hypothetical protein